MADRLLSIVIPALDEEPSIGSTVRRCLDARRHIIDSCGVDAIELLVVSDGSSDRTEEIACGFPEATVIAFDRNRGYGAAIQSGFEHARGDLLGFLDADGTCDPRFFADLSRALDAQRADIALGSRMGPGSRMPPLREAGNLLFAWMLGALSKRAVRDTASGMRVLRRAALPDLQPLPDGLHFTPAMSARALLEDKLRLVEVPIPYAERTGRSKLHVAADGVRFVRAIVQAAVAFRPARPLLLGAALMGAAALAVGFQPSFFWLRFGRLEEWMIYRILLASLLATTVALLVCTAVAAEHIAALAHGRPAGAGVTGALSRLFAPAPRRALLTFLGVGAVALVRPGIAEYTTTGQVEMHWSRAVLSSLMLVVAVALASTGFLLRMLELIRAQRAALRAPAPPDRVRPAARPDTPAAPRATGQD